MVTVIGYSFSADEFCVLCADLAGMTAEGATDREGNPVHPIFSTDEQLREVYCGNCGEWIAGPGSEDGLADAVARHNLDHPTAAMRIVAAVLDRRSVMVRTERGTLLAKPFTLSGLKAALKVAEDPGAAVYAIGDEPVEVAYYLAGGEKIAEPDGSPPSVADIRQRIREVERMRRGR